MKKVKIVTDSNSGITQEQAEKLGIAVLPMPFVIEGKDYQEGVTLSRELFYEKLRQGVAVSTSQPTPSAVMDLWDKVLKNNEEIVYIPISSGLSGSYETALSLSTMKKYEERVYVVDNGRVSTPHRRSVMDAIELAEEGYCAKEIKTMLDTAGKNVAIYVAVEDLKYLKQGGRISSATATVGTILNIKPVLYFDTGLIEVFQKCRGTQKAHKVMIEAMRKDLETRFRYWYDRGEVYLLAASSATPEITDSWVREIQEAFPGMDVMCDELAMSVACHIGPGGLGIGCSCKPKRL